MDDFDDILASGDEAAIEAALESLDGGFDMLFDEDHAESSVTSEGVAPVIAPEVEQAKPEDTQAPVVEANSETDVEDTDSSPAQEAAQETQIESKNGKHLLPYGVLSASREETAKAKDALQEAATENETLKQQLAERERQLALHGEQLKGAGVDPKLLPEHMLRDPEFMAKLKEDYPDIGDVVSALAAQVQSSKKVELQTTEADPLEVAFAETEHLQSWRDNDLDRWQLAKQIDDRLAGDPSFEQKTITERFTEVERRVMSAFGDQAQAEVIDNKIITPVVKPSLAAPIPNSPTDIGSQGNDSNPNTQLLDQDAATMTAQMNGMSEAAIEALLEDAADFL